MSGAWIVSAGAGNVRHLRDNEFENRLWSRCSGAINPRYRPATPAEVEVMPTCKICERTLTRDAVSTLRTEVRGATYRMYFARQLRWVADEVSHAAYLPGPGRPRFPERFIDDKQRDTFLDCFREAGQWLAHAHEILDPAAAAEGVHR
jgi:hypothetical protein